MTTEPFNGAKLAILVGDRIVTILRDDRPDIPWPAHWDLPGGGREGEETPEACVLRELQEELGVTLAKDDLLWGMSELSQGSAIWFFVSEQPNFECSTVQFGDEGQMWKLAPIDWYLEHPKSIPTQKARLRAYLDQRKTPS